MGQRDLHNSIEQRNALDVATISSDTTTAGDIIDTQDFESLEFLTIMGTLTDGDYTLLIEHGDDSGLSDAAAVPDAQLLGTEVGASFPNTDDDNKVSKIGYIGSKRYVRLSVVSDNTSSGATFGAVAVLGHTRRTEDLTGQISA